MKLTYFAFDTSEARLTLADYPRGSSTRSINYHLEARVCPIILDEKNVDLRNALWSIDIEQDDESDQDTTSIGEVRYGDEGSKGSPILLFTVKVSKCTFDNVCNSHLSGANSPKITISVQGFEETSEGLRWSHTVLNVLPVTSINFDFDLSSFSRDHAE